MQIYVISILFVQVLILVFQIMVFTLHKKTLNRKDNEFYTDYVHGKMVLRVFKPEFEYQAIGNIKGEILERGNLSLYYMWALIKFN